MGIIINVFPDQTPPRGAYVGATALGATVRIVPEVDVLFGPDHEANVAYLREWAANMTALADEIEAAQSTVCPDPSTCDREHVGGMGGTPVHLPPDGIVVPGHFDHGVPSDAQEQS